MASLGAERVMVVNGGRWQFQTTLFIAAALPPGLGKINQGLTPKIVLFAEKGTSRRMENGGPSKLAPSEQRKARRGSMHG
jgi:hypothetical protein